MKSPTYTIWWSENEPEPIFKERMYAVLTRHNLTHLVSDYYPGTVIFKPNWKWVGTPHGTLTGL